MKKLQLFLKKPKTSAHKWEHECYEACKKAKGNRFVSIGPELRKEMRNILNIGDAEKEKN